jgi:hypothetical protein
VTDQQPTNPAASSQVHTLPDGRTVALGRPRASALDDPRTLRRFALRRFLNVPQLPPLEPKVERPAGYQPRMFANDRLGDCTIAGKANFTLLSAARVKAPAPNISDQDVVSDYSAETGYNPADPATDQGAIELDILNHWRKAPFAGVQLAAFVSIDTNDLELLRYGIQLFGAVYVGLALPVTAQHQVGKLWDTAPGMVPGDWGGHCVIVSAYDYAASSPVLDADTWGASQLMSEAFWRACGDEAYAPLPTDYQNVPGLDYTALEAELGQLGQDPGAPAAGPPH